MNFNFNLKGYAGRGGASIRRRTTACGQDHTVGILPLKCEGAQGMPPRQPHAPGTVNEQIVKRLEVTVA